MGLIKEEEKTVILADIVWYGGPLAIWTKAGTRKVTAIQMDIKIAV